MDKVSTTSAQQFAPIDSNMQLALKLYRIENGNNTLPHLTHARPFVGKNFIQQLMNIASRTPPTHSDARIRQCRP